MSLLCASSVVNEETVEGSHKIETEYTSLEQISSPIKLDNSP